MTDDDRPEARLPERHRATGTLTDARPAQPPPRPEVTTVSAPMLTADESAEDSALFSEAVHGELPPPADHKDDDDDDDDDDALFDDAVPPTGMDAHANTTRAGDDEDDSDDDDDDDAEGFLGDATVAENVILPLANDTTRVSAAAKITEGAEKTVVAPVDFEALNRNAPLPTRRVQTPDLSDDENEDDDDDDDDDDELAMADTTAGVDDIDGEDFDAPTAAMAASDLLTADPQPLLSPEHTHSETDPVAAELTAPDRGPAPLGLSLTPPMILAAAVGIWVVFLVGAGIFSSCG